MIPKTIHYNWFSAEPFPKQISECIESWKSVLTDYEFVLWDRESIKDINVPYMHEALSVNKWACASDYVRLYAIFHHGGIYLDTDVFLHKSFDDLLDNRLFIGRENSWHICGHDTVNWLTSHCFGAEKEHPFLKLCMAYYESMHYIFMDNKDLPAELRYNSLILPYVQAVSAQKFGYIWNVKQNHEQKTDMMTVYPSTWFDGQKTDKNCICSHLALGSWREHKMYKPEYNLKYKIRWRLIAVIEWIARRFSCTLVRLT
jgi:hypothetical protein